MGKPKRNIQAVAEETLTPPDSLTNTQTIAQVVKAAGNNLYQLELPDHGSVLAELNAKFRSTIWIKRGNYVLLDSAATAERENKIAGEIVNIVRDEKAWRKMPYWPAEFTTRKAGYDSEDEDSEQGPQMPPSDSDED